jgi:molybdopterin adenylyltransferase
MTMKTVNLQVVSVNVSKEKGTVKSPAPFIELDKTGIQGDAHAGNWHRQVSLLGEESINRFSSEAGRKISFGEFAENITTKGLELVDTLPLDRLVSDMAELEITQIGKKCHGSNCAIFTEVGNCVMPKEGIFARVIRGGRLRAGDMFSYSPRRFRFLVVTLSDRASRGEYEDRSGPEISRLLREFFDKRKRGIDIDSVIIPDEEAGLKDIIGRSRFENFDFIITTGGTGIGTRDITPDVIRPMLDKEIPGIMEMIRMKYGAEKPNALLSRGVAGLMGTAFVYTLPGSVKAVNEYMTEILKTMEHLVYMLNGLDSH